MYIYFYYTYNCWIKSVQGHKRLISRTFNGQSMISDKTTPIFVTATLFPYPSRTGDVGSKLMLFLLRCYYVYPVLATLSPDPYYVISRLRSMFGHVFPALADIREV